MQCVMQGIPFQVEPEAQSYPLGRLNCDPPVALLRSVMEHMSRVANEKKKGMGRPEFVIFTGDIPSHQLSCQYHQARVIELVARLQVSHLMTEVGIWGGYNESSSKFIYQGHKSCGFNNGWWYMFHMFHDLELWELLELWERS